VLSGEPTNTNFRLKHTIYRTGGEHASYYTINAVGKIRKEKIKSTIPEKEERQK